MKKLLVIGSNTIHVYNFINLIKDYFDDILLLTNDINSAWDVDAIEIDFSLGLNMVKSIQEIRQQYMVFSPSMVHIHQANSYAFLTVLALKKYDIPIVLTAWGSDILINPKKSFLLKKMVQYILNNVQVITADSDYVLSNAQQLVEKKLYLHNVNFGITIEDCKEKEKKNIVYSNRLHKELYNIDKIIVSFSKFVANKSDWKLVIAGRGEQTKALKILVHSLNIDKHVEFVGFLNQEENYSYYCRSKIYLSIPRSDSISISLVEAIVCGCVPFVSNLEANLELIEDNQNGFIEDDLENIDFEKYQQIETEYLEATREKLKISFSKEYNKNRYIEIYNKVEK